MARVVSFVLLGFVLYSALSISYAANNGRGRLKSSDVEVANGQTRGVGRYAKATSGQAVPTRPRSRGGISAWGIIALIVGTIFVFMTIYYFILFYPLVCARERKYDVMESSPV